MKTIIVSEEDIRNLMQIAVNYKDMLDLAVENAKIIPYSDITGIEDHFALYEKVKHICE